MKFRNVFIGLTIFMVVTTVMTWLVYVTLRRDIAGSTREYSAMFTDVFGLRVSDDVRMAGVRVGRVQKIDLQPDGTAKVTFVVQDDQTVMGNTVAAVVYQNVVGQRYVGLLLGNVGDPTPLPEGSVIPLERTEPSFDVGIVLNGYKPLFSTIDPKVVDQLSAGVIESLQGDPSAMATLVDQTGQLTDKFAGRDEVLGNLITNMDKLFGTLGEQNDNLDKVLVDAKQMVNTLNGRRPELVSSMGSISRVVRQLSSITDEVTPQLTELVRREPGFAAHMLAIEPQVAFTGANLPHFLKGLARATSEGAYANVYACDVNALGFFPGLNDVTPIIVNAATPGNKSQYTPRCRSMANG